MDKNNEKRLVTLKNRKRNRKPSLDGYCVRVIVYLSSRYGTVYVKGANKLVNSKTLNRTIGSASYTFPLYVAVHLILYIYFMYNFILKPKRMFGVSNANSIDCVRIGIMRNRLCLF